MGSIAIPASGNNNFKTGTATFYFSGAGFTGERKVNAALSVTLPKEPKIFAITSLSCGTYNDAIEIYNINDAVINGVNVSMVFNGRQYKTTANNSMAVTVKYIYM